MSDSGSDSNPNGRRNTIRRSRNVPQDPIVEEETVSDLDNALAHVLESLDSDSSFNRETWLNKFPQWASELNEFIDDWLAIERQTAKLTPPLRAGHDRTSPLQNEDSPSLGDYKLIREIGSGGMGIIYEARQISLDRIVALKMIHNARQDRNRFRVEAEAAASLHHDNIVSIYEIGEHESQPFISMQFVNGGNLKERLEKQPLAPKEAARILETIARAVHYAHQRGILHRDLKPANVLIDTQGKPFVTDFGLAKQMGNSAELTRSGAVLGTPGYMSPEQAMGQVKSITLAADVYGLGAILYALLTGEAPFRGDSDLKTLRRVIEEQPESPRTKRPEIDRNIETICLKCLEKMPAARYTSAEHLADDLARYLRGEPVLARPVGRLQRKIQWCRRNPALALLALAVVGSLTIALVVSVTLALTESRARQDSDRARVRESLLRHQVERSRSEAEESEQRVTSSLADLYTSNGLRAAEMEFNGEAMLWFASAASLPGVDQATIDANNNRCMSWMASSPMPIAAKQFSPIPQHATALTDLRSIQHRPGRPELMAKIGDEFFVWNYNDEEIWRPREQELRVSVGAWSTDGTVLVLGCQSGEIRFLDADTFEVVANFFLEEPISQIVFSSDGSSAAIANGNSVQICDVPSGDFRGGSLSHDEQVVHVSFGGSDRFLVTTSRNERCQVFDLGEDSPDPKMACECYLGEHVRYAQDFAPVISHNAKTLFVRTERSKIRLYDPVSGEEQSDPLNIGESNSIIHSPDFVEWLECGETDGRLWYFNRGDSTGTPFLQRHHRLPHRDRVATAAFSSQGIVATASDDDEVRLWLSAKSRRVRGRWFEPGVLLAVLPHMNEVVKTLFSMDGERLITLQRDGLVRVWSIPEFDAPGYRVRVPDGGSSARVIDNENWLVAGMTHWRGHMVNASLRRLRDGQVVAETPLSGLGERGHLLDADIDPNQEWFVTLHAAPSRSGGTMIPKDDSPAGFVIFWDTLDGTQRSPSIPVAAEPRATFVFPDSERVAVVTADMNVVIINSNTKSIETVLESGKREQKPDLNSVVKPVFFQNGRVSLSPDEKTIYAWGAGTGMRAWDANTHELRFAFETNESERVHAIDIHPNGKSLALILGQRSEVVILDALTGEQLNTIAHPNQAVVARFSPDGRKIVTGCIDGRARVFDVDQFENMEFDLVHTHPVIDVLYSPDGSLIATLSGDRRLRVWYSENASQAIKTAITPGSARRLFFSPDASYIVAAGIDAELQVYDLTWFQKPTDLELTRVTQIAELLSGKSIDDRGMENMTTADWIARWQDYTATVSVGDR